jgi:nitrate/nitrite-specific signal transduction histidine kinase
VDGQDIVAGFATVPGTTWGLITEESWATLTSGSRGYQQFLLLLLVLGVVVPALVVAVGVRRIMHPIEALIGAAKEVARGNFGQTITAQTGDEIEELAQQFNLMSAQLQESYTHLEQRVADRTKELAILNAIGASVNESLDLYETLDRILDETLGLLNLEVGEICLLDEDSDELVIRTERGLSLEFVRQANRRKVSELLPESNVLSGEPVIEEDVFANP